MTARSKVLPAVLFGHLPSAALSMRPTLRFVFRMGTQWGGDRPAPCLRPPLPPGPGRATSLAMRSLVRPAATLIALLVPVAAQAAPSLRKSISQRGDAIIIGNTVARDCGPGVPAPLGGVLGACGANTDDSAPDVFFQLDTPAVGQISSSTAISEKEASSLAVLAQGTTKGVSLPIGAAITYARLYWGGTMGLPEPGNTVTLFRPLGFSATITADTSQNTFVAGNRWYQASADVTDLVRRQGTGAYAVKGISSRPLAGLDNNEAYAGWGLVVFYHLDSAPVRSLSLWDGFDVVSTGKNLDATLTGFLVPNTGHDATIGMLSYEGDDQHDGDQLLFGPSAAALTTLSNAVNPANNFFNGTRSSLGVPFNHVLDLPRLTGGARSLASMDLDVIDVTALMKPQQTSSALRALTNNDTFAVGSTFLSVSTVMPDFSKSPKTVKNISRPGASTAAVGEVLEFSIEVKNDGVDTSARTVLSDLLPLGLGYVPGSIKIASGANAGAKSDAAGDDEAEFNTLANTLTVRLGAGASSTQGGQIAVGASSTVTFQVKVNAGAPSQMANLGAIAASGILATAQGMKDSQQWGTMNPQGQVNTPTLVAVGADADGDGVPDEIEDALKTNKNNPDSDGDGVPDGQELGAGFAPIDTDKDGIIDALDPDDDGDGIPTKEELGAVPGTPRDTDKDGKADFIDADDDGDGIPTSTEIADAIAAKLGIDVDGDGKANWLDTDADGDGISDEAEGRGDTDADSIPDYLDALQGTIADAGVPDAAAPSKDAGSAPPPEVSRDSGVIDEGPQGVAAEVDPPVLGGGGLGCGLGANGSRTPLVELGALGLIALARSRRKRN